MKVKIPKKLNIEAATSGMNKWFLKIIYNLKWKHGNSAALAKQFEIAMLILKENELLGEHEHRLSGNDNEWKKKNREGKRKDRG